MHAKAEPIPNRILELRKRRGLSQQELGALVGTGNQQISRLEKGERKLTTQWMNKLAKALNVEPWELLAVQTGDGPADEKRALELFRSISESRRPLVLELLEWLAKG